MDEQELRYEFERIYTPPAGTNLGEVIWVVFLAGATFAEARTREEFIDSIKRRCGDKYAKHHGDPLDIFERVIMERK